MSGVLSIAREVLSIFFPDKIPPRSLFWNCVVIAFIISAAILWFIEHQKAEANKPKLNARFDVFSVAPAGEKEENSIITISGIITNVGTPSIVDNIEVSIKIQDKYFKGQLLFLPPGGITLQGEGKSFFVKSEDYLPRKCLAQPIATGGAVNGFVILLFSELNREEIFHLGTTVIITFNDVVQKKYRFEKIMSDQRVFCPFGVGS